MKEQSEKEINRNANLAEVGKEYRFNSENARENQKKGALAKHKNAERRKSMQDIAKWLGSIAVNKNEILDPEDILDLETSQAVNMTASEAIVLAQYQKAIAGDTASAIFIRDTIGEKPKEEIEVHGLTMDEYAQKHKPKF